MPAYLGLFLDVNEKFLHVLPWRMGSMFIIPRTVNDEKEKMVDAPGYFGFKWNTFLSKECGE
jgi:hypothetical protein